MFEGRGPDEPLTQMDVDLFVSLTVRTEYHSRFETAGVLVQEKDREDVVLHRCADGRRYLVDEFFDVERRRDLEADVVQERYDLAIAPLAFVEIGVFDGDRDLAGEHAQDPNLVFVEVGEFGALDVEYAQDPSLADQGNGQFRAGR